MRTPTLLLLPLLLATGCAKLGQLGFGAERDTCELAADRVARKLTPRVRNASAKVRLATLVEGTPLTASAVASEGWTPPDAYRPLIAELAHCELARARSVHRQADVVLATWGLDGAAELDATVREGLIVAITEDTTLDATRRYHLGRTLVGSVGWSGAEGADLMWAGRQTLSLAAELGLPGNQVRDDLGRSLADGVNRGRLLSGSKAMVEDRLFAYRPVRAPEPACQGHGRTQLEDAIKSAADFSFYAELLPADHGDRKAFERDRARLAEVSAFVTLSCATR